VRYLGGYSDLMANMPRLSPAGSPLTVLVADDHRVAAEALAAYLESASDIARALVATDGSSVVRRIRGGVDVLVIDHTMQDGESGTEIVEAVSHLGTGTGVLLLSASDDPEGIAEALERGAHGCCSKLSSPAQVLDAVRRVADRETVLPAGLVGPVLQAMAGRGRRERQATEVLAGLTRRERQVLAFLGRGLSRARIAEELGVSPNTVRTHVQRILAKLSVHNQLEAAAVARRVLAPR
jgi:two-component system, NarL family, nitrate/nitrite response regulator NarL